MTTLQKIEGQVAKLSRKDFRAFREWIDAYENENWDKQFNKDVSAGRLDKLGKKALREFRAGKCAAI